MRGTLSRATDRRLRIGVYKMGTEAELFDALALRVEISEFGTRGYYNSAGQLHRDGGPAVIWCDGSKEWWQNGQLHRENGPAVERANGYKEWWSDGQLHRVGGPAIEYTTGDKRWFLNGDEYTAHDYRVALVKRGLAK